MYFLSTINATNSGFDASNVNLTSVNPQDVYCALQASRNEYNGQLGARISALFVILICSTVATFFPFVAKRVPRLRIPLHVYLLARYFGAGVIVATAFIHLLDPAYQEIGPQTCVGQTGGWAGYSWPPAIVLGSVLVIFLVDFGAERYVEMKYGVRSEQGIQPSVPTVGNPHGEHAEPDAQGSLQVYPASMEVTYEKGFHQYDPEADSAARKQSFRQQIAAFLVLDFGVIFHSVIIGLNLGVAGSDLRRCTSLSCFTRASRV